MAEKYRATRGLKWCPVKVNQLFRFDRLPFSNGVVRCTCNVHHVFSERSCLKQCVTKKYDIQVKFLLPPRWGKNLF